MVAPETALTGYFLEGGVRDLAITADQLFDDLSRQHHEAGAPPLDVALGFYEVHGNRLYNSALYATLGGPDAGIRHIHRKIFLPTYGVFDEERFVEAGRSVQAFDTRWGRAAILICEDAWHSFTPMLAALDGAQLIIVPSASPARGVITSDDTAGRPGESGALEPAGAGHRRGARRIRGAGAAGWIRGWQGVSRRVDSGRPAGRPAGSGAGVPGGDHPWRCWTSRRSPGPAPISRCWPTWRCGCRICWDRCMRRGARSVGARRGTTGDNEAARQRHSEAEHPRAGERPRVRAPLLPASRVAASPPDPQQDPLAIDAELTQHWLVEFIRDEVQRRRKFDKVVIGLSGGVDSSLVAYLAAEALGAANVLGGSDAVPHLQSGEPGPRAAGD